MPDNANGDEPPNKDILTLDEVKFILAGLSAKGESPINLSYVIRVLRGQVDQPTWAIDTQEIHISGGAYVTSHRVLMELLRVMFIRGEGL